VVVVQLSVVQHRPLEVGDVSLDGEERVAGAAVDRVRDRRDGPGDAARRIRRVESPVVIVVFAIWADVIKLFTAVMSEFP
jgi:hypothetical protein